MQQATAIKEPRPHQAEMLSGVPDELPSGSARGKIIGPCGIGKTLLGIWASEKLGAQQILVAVPTLLLLRQTMLVWQEHFRAANRSCEWIAVCSDRRIDGKVKLPFPVKSEIAPLILNELFAHVGPKVVFTTYSSSRAVAAAAKMADLTFDVILFDEA